MVDSGVPLMGVLMQHVLSILGSIGFFFISVFGPWHGYDVQSAAAQLGKPEGLYYKSWAIIIGVENYLLAPPIAGVLSDANKVAETFRQLGFEEVVELYEKDASAHRLRQVFNDILPRKVGRMDRLVIFYAGHAGVAQDSDGVVRSYLVPLDAPLNLAAKSLTVDYLKEFTRRSASKHTLLILDAPVFGWETTETQPLSLEGRVAPEGETERRAVQVISAARQGEPSLRQEDRSLFVQALLAGLTGAADRDQDGWLTATELGAFVSREVATSSNDLQHPTSLRIGGDGDMALIEGRDALVLGTAPQTPEERRQAARGQYELAFALVREGRLMDRALDHLDRAIHYDPTFGEAHVLKSYLRLEVVPDLDQALASAELAVKYAQGNADAFYVLGLIHQKRGNFAKAESSLLQALKLKTDYADVYLSLGLLYSDHLQRPEQSVDAFRRYLELGGVDNRARTAVDAADREGQPSP